MIEAAIACLALNIYHEARGEPLAARQGVAQVTMTRAHDDPKNVCKVVYQPYQFSWANRLIGKKGADRQRAMRTLAPKEAKAWKDCVELAKQAVAGELPDVVGNAIYFTNMSINNKRWARGKTFVARHGKTSFYL